MPNSVLKAIKNGNKNSSPKEVNLVTTTSTFPGLVEDYEKNIPMKPILALPVPPTLPNAHIKIRHMCNAIITASSTTDTTAPK